MFCLQRSKKYVFDLSFINFFACGRLKTCILLSISHIACSGPQYISLNFHLLNFLPGSGIKMCILLSISLKNSSAVLTSTCCGLHFCLKMLVARHYSISLAALVVRHPDNEPETQKLSLQSADNLAIFEAFEAINELIVHRTFSYSTPLCSARKKLQDASLFFPLAQKAAILERV